MTERSTFDPFEQRLAGDFERYVAPATDPKPASEIAAVAMRPRRLAVRARNTSRPRRFLLLGLAAAFLVPAAYIGAGNLRPPTPDQAVLVQPSPTDDSKPTAVPSAHVPSAYVSIFLRRDDGPEPGVSILAVRPDGNEVLVRKVPDSIVPGRGRLGAWGAVSRSGWLALGVDVYGGPWPLILVDLGDEQATPWVIDEASTGGIGPRWGPTGLVAANAPGGLGQRVVIADPETHSTRIVSMQGHELVGGGPSIVWSADGSGIIGSTEGGTYKIVPIDGGPPRPGVGQVFDPRGNFGPGLAGLRICSLGENCPSGDDGRIEQAEPDGSARTIWRQVGGDRALAASFGGRADEYWLSLDHDNGRQVALVHVHDGRQDAVAAVNRDAAWEGVGEPRVAPDQSSVVYSVGAGGKPAAILVPLTGARQSFHTGQFAGFVDSAASTVFATGQYEAPTGIMPAAGQAYGLPPLEDLIADELEMNPGRTVLGKASRDAVEGETGVRTFEVPRDLPGAGEVFFECFGPSSLTLTSGSNSVTAACLRVGGFGVIDASGPLTISASGDTSWRVAIYGTAAPAEGATEPPTSTTATAPTGTAKPAPTTGAVLSGAP